MVGSLDAINGSSRQIDKSSTPSKFGLPICSVPASHLTCCQGPLTFGSLRDRIKTLTPRSDKWCAKRDTQETAAASNHNLLLVE